MFLGMLRLTSIFLFGVSCLVVAPAFAAAEYPWYLAPAGKTLHKALILDLTGADSIQWLWGVPFPCSLFPTQLHRG